MARHENTSPADDKALNAAQVGFTANPLFLPPQIVHFWQAQTRVLDEIEKFTSGWFRRREDETRTLFDAGRRVIARGGSNPATAVAEMTDWHVGSMARVADDAKDYTDMMSRCAGAIVSNEVEAMEETAKTTARAAKSRKSEPGSIKSSCDITANAPTIGT